MDTFISKMKKLALSVGEIIEFTNQKNDSSNKMIGEHKLFEIDVLILFEVTIVKEISVPKN